MGRYRRTEHISPKIDPPQVAEALKVGIHLSMFNYNQSQLLGLLHKLVQQGRPCPLITLLGPDEIPASLIRNTSPATTIILRVWRSGDGSLDMSAAEYFGRYVDPYPERAAIKYHQPNNEVIRYDPGAITWWMANAAWTQNHGDYRLVGPGWATGYDLDVWKRQDTQDMMRYFRDHGHIISVHEYYRGDLDWELGRFVHHVLPLLPSDLQNNMPKVAFTEWGQQNGANISDADWLTFLKAGQVDMAKYPWIIGGATWAIGDTGNTEWIGDNWANKLWLLTQV